MKVAIFGSDGRAHALAWKLFNSHAVRELDCLPGNAGTIPFAPHAGRLVPDQNDSLTFMANWVLQEGLGLAIDAQGDLLERGLADELATLQLTPFGPPQQTALALASRCRTKEVLLNHRIPTAPGHICYDLDTAEKYLATAPLPIVIRPNTIHAAEAVYTDRLAALEGLKALFNPDIHTTIVPGVVIEQAQDGQRVIMTALTDGTTVLPFIPVAIHPSVEPIWYTGTSRYAALLREFLHQRVMLPLLTALSAEGLSMNGFLGVECLITRTGPLVRDLRASFAPGEAEVVLPRMETDLVPLCQAVVGRTLGTCTPPTFRMQASVGLGLVGNGYPHHFPTGGTIQGIDMLDQGVLAFHQATDLPIATPPSDIRSRFFGRTEALPALPRVTGGHVLTVVSQGATLEEAWTLAQRNARLIEFPGQTFQQSLGTPIFS